ncbi:hypothetical protein ACFL4W_02325 [Planctomycetota bacterium]
MRPDKKRKNIPSLDMRGAGGLLRNCLLSSVFCLLFAGCSASTRRTENLSSYVELLIRGDKVNAGEVLKRENNGRFLDLYILLLPKLRSLDDRNYYYPPFIEKRQYRYGTIREYKRAGLLGEGLDGRVKIVTTNPGANRAVIQGTLNDLTTRENFDREQIMGFLSQNHSGLSRKKLVAAFVKVRFQMALNGDMVEEVGADGNITWVKTKRE